MQKQQKIIALTVVLAIVVSITAVSSLEHVLAENAGMIRTRSEVPFKSFDLIASDIVCGDQLCNEAQSSINIEEETPVSEIVADDSAAPTVKLISIDRYRPSSNQQDPVTYRITFSLTAGQADLRDIQINAKSDIDNENFEIASLNALKSSVNVIRIKALDPDSITGEITGYSITGPTGNPLR